MFSSSGTCLNGCTAEHFHSVLPGPSASNFDASGGSVPANRGSKDRRGLSDRSLYSAENTGSRLMCSSQLKLNASEESCAAHLSRINPPGSQHHHHGCGVKRSHQAKRARVENIIKGITCSDGTTHPFNQSDYMQEDEGIQELLHQKRWEQIRSESLGQNQMTRKEFESQHQHLRTELSHTEGETEDTNNEKDKDDQRWVDSPEPSLNTFCDSGSEFESRESSGWTKVKLVNYFQSKPDRIKLMTDILKYELSRAVSSSVDSIFESLPLLQTSMSHGGTGVPLQATAHKESKFRVPCCDSAEMLDIQTEALSLVIQKPDQERPNSFVLESSSPRIPKTSMSPCHESALHVERHSTEHQLAFRRWQDEGSEAGHWNPFQVKSKVNSRSVRSPQTPSVPMDQLLDSLSTPHVKVESDNLEKTNLYMLNVSFSFILKSP